MKCFNPSISLTIFHCGEGQFSTTVVRAWWIVWVRKGLPVLATVTVAEAMKWSRAVVSPSDSVVSENSALNSLVRLGRQSVRRVRSVWYCSGGNRFLSILANRLA